MTTEIKAPFTGKIIAIAAGAITAGSALFKTEAMKMEIPENSCVPGVFEAVVAIGALVIAGEVIGYFTATTE